MKQSLIFVLAGFFACVIALSSHAQTGENAVTESQLDTPMETILPAIDVNLADFLWKSRVLVVFADTPIDPRVEEQIRYFSEGVEVAQERDLVMVVDSDPSDSTAVRTQLRPRSFAFVLLDKDGTVIIRKASPWHMREIGRVIDKTTIRQEELRRSRGE